MKEQDLIKQLGNLRKVVPDKQWKTRNKEILMAQISGAGEPGRVNYFKVLYNLLPLGLRRIASQPVAVVFFILFVVFGSGIISLKASLNSVPGDSLYIAKRISEKTQFALTFNETAKTKLTLEFAQNRAKELATVLAEPNDRDEKQEKVDRLTENFNKEIDTAKSRLNKIAKADEPAKEPAVSEPESGAAIGEAASTTSEDKSMQVFSADLGKDEKGIQVYSGEQSETADSGDAPEEGDTVEPEEAAEEDLSTTSDAVIAFEEGEESAETGDDPAKILDEAKELFNQQDIDGTLSKLDQVNALINGEEPADSQETDGEVKGEQDVSTSTSEEMGEVLGVEEGADEASTTSE